MMRRRTKALLVVLLLPSLALFACQVVAGIDPREVATCDHAAPPERPSLADTDTAADVVPPLLFGLDLGIDLNIDAGNGFDLDHTCSSTSPPSPPPSSCRRCQDPDVDDPNGRDNGVARALSNPLFFFLKDSMGSGPPVSERFHLLVEIAGYNGQANDPSVNVRFYRSHGAEPIALPDAGATPVKRDGGDVWSTTEDSYLSGIAPAKVANDAYVRDGRLYAMADDLEFDFAGAGFVGRGNVDTDRLPIHLTDAVVMLPISKEGSLGVVRGGVITGRWFTKTLLASLAHLRDTNEAGPQSLCGANESYQFLKRRLCVDVDIAERSRIDNTGARCDAISVVFAATGVSGARGSSRLTIPAVVGCDGDWKDDCTEAWTTQNCEFR